MKRTKKGTTIPLTIEPETLIDAAHEQGRKSAEEQSAHIEPVAEASFSRSFPNTTQVGPLVNPKSFGDAVFIGGDRENTFQKAASASSQSTKSVPLPMNLMSEASSSPLDKLIVSIKKISPSVVLKVLVVAVILVAVILIFLGSLNTARNHPSANMPRFLGSSGWITRDSSVDLSDRVMNGMNLGSPTISTRNVVSSGEIMPISYPGSSMGDTAEDFEVKDFTAHIETEKFDSACSSVATLKGLSYVIFENTAESDHFCSFIFKVEHAYVSEILAKIKALDPRSLSENTYTIKQQLDDFTSQTDILENKRQSIQDTLESAISAYDEVTALALKERDAASLSQIITSKVNMIERLTQEQININQQIEHLSKAKQDQLDRITYTYFNVSVSEKMYFDSAWLKDSWHGAIQKLITELSRALQNATIYLLSFIIHLIVWLLYLFIGLVVAKICWKAAMSIWSK